MVIVHASIVIVQASIMIVQKASIAIVSGVDIIRCVGESRRQANIQCVSA